MLDLPGNIISPSCSFGRAEGAVVIVLKPEEQALRDGDKIYATILGTGVNSSGSLAPVNAPVASAQEDAMRRAFQMAGVSPAEVDFLELHATGTARGDPTEANWVGEAFKRDGDILVGSVKSNIGYGLSLFRSKLLTDCRLTGTRRSRRSLPRSARCARSSTLGSSHRPSTFPRPTLPSPGKSTVSWCPAASHACHPSSVIWSQ
jgi:hypothetical protein